MSKEYTKKKDKRPFVFFGIIFVTSAYILFSGPIFMLNLPFLLVQIFSILLIIWALVSKHLQKLPEKNLPHGAFLVTHGPYEIIRHPIYAGLLLIMSAFVQGYSSFSRFLVFVFLLIAVLLKLTYDERILEEHSKEFKEHKQKTHKLIPYLF
ncbi:MAG: methyltransferase [Patescibacteria group bacterium]